MKSILANRRLALTLGLAFTLAAAVYIVTSKGKSRPFRGNAQVMVVMDPLAKQLACACVAGYAQRNYDALASFLSQRLGRRIRAAYSEDLDKALRSENHARVVLIIGKQSVVKSDAAHAGVNVRPLGLLSDKHGGTALTGLFVVKAGDAVTNLAGLKGRRIFFGPSDSDEKHAAALAALRAAGVPLPEKIETRPGCSGAAMEVQDSQEGAPTVAVISSYALPLLEGCGNIDKGSLRVIGQTAPVPFVTVFATEAVSAEQEQQILQALLVVRDDLALLKALESKDGFVAMPGNKPTATDWPGWRGPDRNGLVAALPEKLPATARFIWKKALTGSSLAGLAVARGYVVTAGRDPLDERDLFLCLRADNGEEAWSLGYPAPGKLDYGQSPRATPVIHEGKVYLLGAFGDLHCVGLADGKVVWKKNLLREFDTLPPKWGMTATPLIVDDKLIVNPGAKKASLVALDRLTGKTIWKTPGRPAAYASFIAGRFGGTAQIVGYDAQSLGGWDVKTGRRLWTLAPPNAGDFNVPTPVACEGKLLAATENNGTRLYGFKSNGTILPKPLAEYPDLAPDVNTPVVLNGKVFGCHDGLHCLDLNQGLKLLWTASDPAFGDFVSLIGGGNCVLVVTYRGELLLVAATGNGYKLVSRLRLFSADSEVYSHPALVGARLFIRDNTALCCVDLGSGG